MTHGLASSYWILLTCSNFLVLFGHLWIDQRNAAGGSLLTVISHKSSARSWNIPVHYMIYYMFPVDIWRAFTIGKVPWCLSSSKTGKIASFWRAKQMWFVKLWADRHSVIDLDILAPSPQTPTLHVRRACEWATFSSVHSLGLLVLQICIYFGFTHFWVIHLTSSAMRWANLDSWSRLMH